MAGWELDWPVPVGNRPACAVLKDSPEDFRVDELWDDGGPVNTLVTSETVEVPGSGEHLLVYLEKTGDNTSWVAGQLGELAGCGENGVGYCGLKDRHAITRQWFSMQRPGQASADRALLDQIGQHWPVLAVARRPRKLRRGEHQGNRFVIHLRQFRGDAGAVERVLATIASEGCPNYFGRQRFGHDGKNLDQAVAMAAKPQPRLRRGRRSGQPRQGIYFSAARSWLFNEVLAQRVRDQSWNQNLPGEPDADQPTGPLWGDGGTSATSEQEALERSVVRRSPTIEAVFATSRMAPERRPLVLRPGDLDWQWGAGADERCLTLSFTLAPGQYATSVLSAFAELEAPEAAAP